LRVQYKLFAITLLASSVLVASMLALAQWSFDRGLLEHVNKRAQQQYTSLNEQLAEHYQKYGSWNKLQSSRYSWLQIQADAGIDIEPRELQRARQDERQGSRRYNQPPRRRPGSDKGFRPPPEHRREGGQFRDQYREPPRRDQFNDRPPPPRKAPKQEPLALVDAGKTLISGMLAKVEHRQYLPIIKLASKMTEANKSNADNIIGYLVYANRERLLDDYDLDLSSQLSSNLWWIAGLMILLSASLALPFSQLLLRPLRPIVGSIHTLAKGDFSQRLEVENKDEIGRVAEDINHLAKQLEEIDVNRKTWLANISHELRTPLAVMRGELEAMLDGIRELNKDNLTSAHQEALHLQRLVEDLYQLTSSELGNDDVVAMSYQKQDFDFNALLEDDLARFQPLIEKAGLSFVFNNHIEDLGEEAWVNGDASRLSQLIHNLVNNSIKYTHAPGTLVADLTLHSEVIIFTLMDSAPKVKENELDKIFDHLYRAEQSRNRKTGGSGLGLAICKKIAQSHEGELSASLSDLGGIKMTLCLPRV
jgi:two-component system sensor histidine kinase BaeS